MKTLATIALADFADRLGEKFQLQAGPGAAVEVTLASASSLGFNPRAGGAKADRESFSVMLHAPKTWKLPQGTYRLVHPDLGALDLFLVPLGPDEQAMRLEAIFNFT